MVVVPYGCSSVLAWFMVPDGLSPVRVSILCDATAEFLQFIGVLEGNGA